MTQFRSSLIAVLGIFLLASCDGASLPTTTAPEALAATFAPAVTPPPSSQISLGNYHSCALGTDGRVRCWGLNKNGQAPPEKVAAIGSFTRVSAGGAHTCALRGDGVVECWGLNTDGQAPPTRTATAGTFVQVSASDRHTCGLRNDGVIECWGTTAPQAVTGGGFAELSKRALCALRTDGGVTCPGSPPSVRYAAVGTFVEVASNATGNGACALRSDGVAECWGEYRQFTGLWSATTGTFTQISQRCGLRNDGVVECRGQAPVAAGTGSFTQVDNGAAHVCALRSDGLVECWGQNTYGQAPPIALSGPVPAAPSNLSGAADSSRSRVVLTWTDNSAAELEHRIERRPFENNGWILVGTTGPDVLTFTDTTAVPEQHYYYRVYACNDSGCSRPSAEALVSTLTPPASPAAATATPFSGTIVDVRWADSSSNEQYFELARRSRSAGGAWGSFVILTARPTPNSTSFRDTGLSAGTTYQYWVRACNSGGCSAPDTTNEVTTPTLPAAPTGFSATPVSPTAIRLAWTDASSNETYFQLTRRTLYADGTWSPWQGLATTPADSTGYTNTTVPAGTYEYRVRACNAAGCSAYAAAGAMAGAAPTPTNATATAVSPTEIQLTWTDAGTNESHFQIGRRTRNADGSWSGFLTLAARPAANSTSFRDTGLTPGTGYQYRVRACNASGCSTPALTPEAVTPAS
jgi:hypothetical protein